MINVLHLRSSSGLYGAEHVILNLTSSTSPHCSHQLAVIQNYLNDNDELFNAATENGISTRKLNCSAKFDFSTIKALRKILKDSAIDVLHCHDPKSVFYATLATMLQRKPKKIVTMHGWVKNDINMKFNNFVEKLCLPFFSKIVAVSKEISRDLSEIVSGNKILLIENAINTEKFHPDNTRKTPTSAQVNLLIVGRLSPEKGHENLLTALSLLAQQGNENWHLNIVGDGELKEALLAKTAQLKLKTLVTFHGVQKNMLPYYQKSNIYVSSSLTEGMPLVLLEAMSCQLPILATPVGAIPEILRNSEAGILSEDSSVQALCSGLSKILSLNEQDRKNMADKGRKYVQNNLSLTLAIKKHEDLYTELLN